MVPAGLRREQSLCNTGFRLCRDLAAFGQSGLEQIGMLIATIVGSSFTVLAHWRKWQLPSHNDWTLTMTATQLRALLRLRSVDHEDAQKIIEERSDQ